MNSTINAVRRLVAAIVLAFFVIPSLSIAATEAEKKEAENAISKAAKLRGEGQYATAREQYLRFASLVPEDQRCAWALIQAGDMDLQAGKPEEAMLLYSKAVEGYPGTADSKLASSRLETASKAAAEKALKRAEAPGEDREKMSAMMDAGAAYEKGGDLVAAIRTYQEAKRFALTREDLRELSLKASAVLARAEKELEAGPPVPDGEKWLALANLSEAAQEWDRAAGYYLKLAGIAKEGEDRQGYSLRAANALQSAGKPAEAAAKCSEVAAAGPKGAIMTEAYRCAGMAYESLKDWREALTIYETYLEKVASPGERAWALMRSAWCEEMSGNSEGAMNFYNEILKTVPRNYMAPEALAGLGMLYESQKEYREARASYRRILDEYAGCHKESEAKRRLEELAVKEKEWEKVREKLSGLSEQYPKRERGEGL